MTDDSPDSTGGIDDLAEARARIDALRETAAALEAFGERAGMPAIECNAARIDDVAAILAMNVPPELVEDETDGENVD
jgi:hypothetical protein